LWWYGKQRHVSHKIEAVNSALQKTGTQEGVARRLRWDCPEGANVLAEYWLGTEAPRVIAVMEEKE
jgi:hypothetical protein